MFILSDEAIKAIQANPILKAKLQLALDVSEQSIYRFYSNNEVNNDLTKYAALEVIIKETGFGIGKILEKVKDKVIAK